MRNNGVDDAQTREPRGRGRFGDGKRGTSWTGVVSGWLAAAGVALVLGGVLLTGGTDENVARSEVARVLMTLTVAYLIGGYVAGRMAGRRGLKHGLLVFFLSLGLAAVSGLFWLTVGAGLAEARQSLGTLLSPAGLLVLLLSFLGAAFGGVRGAKTGHENP